MRRNCNLELQLQLHHPSADSSFPNPNETQQQEQHEQQQQQQMTIFYNRMMCVRDVTELQARSIIFLANKEMEERIKGPFTPSGSSEPPSPNFMSPLGSPVAGTSLKRSLQSFFAEEKASESSNISIPSLGTKARQVYYLRKLDGDRLIEESFL